MPGENAEGLDLDKVMKEGMQQFTGQESAMTLEDPGKTAGTQESAAGEKGSEAGKETETAGQTGKEKETSGEAEGKGKESEAGKQPGAEDTKTQERMQTLEEENRALKQEKATAEAAEARQKADADFEKSVEEFSEAENRKALAAIDALDPDEFKTTAEFQQQVAKIWAKKETAVAKHVRVVGKETVVSAPGAEAGKGAEQGAKPGTGEEDKGSHTWDEVTKVAKDAELDPGDPAFGVFCRQAPTQDTNGNRLDFNAQVQWAVNETKEFNRLRKLDQESKGITAEQLAARRQELEQPMGRGSAALPGIGGGARETAKPVSLNDALDFAAQKRTL